jgi:hypothetical protein
VVAFIVFVLGPALVFNLYALAQFVREGMKTWGRLARRPTVVIELSDRQKAPLHGRVIPMETAARRHPAHWDAA